MTQTEAEDRVMAIRDGADCRLYGYGLECNPHRLQDWHLRYLWEWAWKDMDRLLRIGSVQHAGLR